MCQWLLAQVLLNYVQQLSKESQHRNFNESKSKSHGRENLLTEISCRPCRANARGCIAPCSMRWTPR